MVTKTIKIRIPDWLYRYRWDNLKKYTKWLMKPNRCSVCGTKMNFSHPEITWSPNGVRKMILHYDIAGEYKACICPTCVADRVSVENAVSKYDKDEISEYDIRHSCDCCNETKTAYKWVAFKLADGRKVGMITGREWWNGFYFCPDCIRSALLEGKESSSIHTSYRAKDGDYYSIPLNNFGLPVVDDKVKFPW